MSVPDRGRKTPSSTGLKQQQYDIAYAQCMAADGNHLDPNPIRYTPDDDADGVYAYPAYYGPWFGPATGVGFIGLSVRGFIMRCSPIIPVSRMAPSAIGTDPKGSPRHDGCNGGKA